MYYPETEDMLPRAAPKPSAAADEVQLKPIVPEISMLFGAQTQQQTAQVSQSQPQTQTFQVKTTYAAWKKQAIPKVRYVATETNNSNTGAQPASTVFRPQATIVSSSLQTAPEPPANSENSPVYRRSFDNPPMVFASAPNIPSGYNTPPSTTYHQAILQQQQRRSHDIIASMQANNACLSLQTPPSRPTTSGSNNNDVLTICAGTQTDSQLLSENMSTQMLLQFANKTDFEQLYFLVQEIRENQLDLLHICESALQQQISHTTPMQQKVEKKDANTQYEVPAAANNQKMPLKPLNAALAMFQTPQNNPAAQSTAYNANTPLTVSQKTDNRAESPTPMLNTEKTLFMNELALKYLPNEKLNELLSDMQLSGPKHKAIEQLVVTSKSPNEFSNASYKYLKKYRLLPDEHPVASPPNVTLYHGNSANPTNATHNDDYDDDEQDENDVLNLEKIRNKPKFL